MQIIIFISAFIIALLLLFMLIKYSKFIGINDVPNGRSSHKTTIPRSGGIAIFSAFIAVHVLFNFNHFIDYIYIYEAISLIFIIGFLDDKFGISPLLKFIFILLATIILYMHDIKITSIGEYFGYDLVFPSWAVLPFTFFAIAGFTNSLNLMDGLDSSIAIVILLAFLALGFLKPFYDNSSIACPIIIQYIALAYLLHFIYELLAKYGQHNDYCYISIHESPKDNKVHTNVKRYYHS